MQSPAADTWQGHRRFPAQLPGSLPAAAEVAWAKLRHWADLITFRTADSMNEKALLPDFLTNVFVDLLRYPAPAGSGDTSPSRARHTSWWWLDICAELRLSFWSCHPRADLT